MPSLLSDVEKVVFSREVRANNIDKQLQAVDEDLDKWWLKVQRTDRYPQLSKVGLAGFSFFLSGALYINRGDFNHHLIFQKRAVPAWMLQQKWRERLTWNRSW
jgi:hypothetical protein